MIDTMEAIAGVGLAAPQIGIGLSLVVVDASEERGSAVRMADPELLSASSETRVHGEASPNLRGVHASIARPARVRVGFTNEDGDREEQEFEGLWGTSIQHQLDHLQGRMYFDNLSRTKRDMLLRKAGKAARKRQW